MQTGGRNTSQQGRVVGRGTAKATRNAEEKWRKPGESGRRSQEAKTSSIADVSKGRTDAEKRRKVVEGGSSVADVSKSRSDAEARRKPTVPPVNRSKPKVIAYSKAYENRVSDSIQKLLSVYQSAKPDKSPDGQRTPNADARKPRIYAGWNSQATKTQWGLRNGPSNADRSYRRRNSSDPRDLAAPNEKSEEAHTRRTAAAPKPKLSPEVSKEIPRTGHFRRDGSGGREDVKAPEETEPCDEIIPLLTPDRTAHTPLTQIRSFIANYLEEDSGNRCDSNNRLELFVPENSVNAFPVCSKRATDHIPSPDPVQQEPPPGEFILMLRRRNSEPYSPKNCILQYSRREDDHPLSPVGSDAWGFGCENYYFWQQGPIRPSKPYWEVSVFKSSCALDSGAATLPSLTPAPGEILINGDFGLRAVMPDRVVRSWSPDLRSCKSAARAVPLTSSVESLIPLPCEPERADTPTEPARERSRGLSKDDHYKHPAHLLVYVKSSQKRFVSLDSGRGRAGNLGNRKVHKIRKIVGGVSEARGTSPSKNIVFAVLSAVLLLTGGLAFFAYFLARGPALFSLTPPIPGLLRRC